MQTKIKDVSRKECCNGCLNGRPGGNPSCQAKLLFEQIKQPNIEHFTNVKILKP